MMSYDDDEASDFEGEYDNGHWVWDDAIGALQFISDKPVLQEEQAVIKSIVHPGMIQFKDDIDVIEQMRFRRRYQRKLTGESDVIMIQDVKDIALYTAPSSVMSSMLINMLHRPTTERFIRALILYCQYYLQVSQTMAARKLESKTKIRTPNCESKENRYKENLNDLRLLIAKDYCTIILGAGDMKPFHHMGSTKKRQSLTYRDSHHFETLLRMCIQIVWLALGRKSFNTIEFELNRLFKTDIFNAAEHILKHNFIDKMSPEEQNVLLGGCKKSQRKLNIRSVLMNATSCERSIDYRMLSLGVIKHSPSNLSPRLRKLMWTLSLPEKEFKNYSIVLGIIGLPRKQFDTMLRMLPVIDDRSAQSQRSGGSRSQGKREVTKLFSDIKLPTAEEIDDSTLLSFEEERDDVSPCPCLEVQRKRWLNRHTRLQGARRKTS